MTIRKCKALGVRLDAIFNELFELYDRVDWNEIEGEYIFPSGFKGRFKNVKDSLENLTRELDT